MARIIAIANQKGGVGKTTTAVNLAAALAGAGKRVLLVDLDSQGNATMGSGVDKRELSASTYDLLLGEASVVQVRVTTGEGFDLLPGNIVLSAAEIQLMSQDAREQRLKTALAPVVSEYDYILIDCPPSLGLLTLNALTASDYVIIPLVAEVLPFNGLKMIFDFINQIKKFLNPKVNIFGIAITRWEGTKLSKNIEEGLRKQLDDLVFTTKIRKNVTIAQAPLEATNIVDYDKKSNGAQDYIALTEEFLERMVLNNVTISK